MRRTAKHNATQIAFTDFSGGINVASTGDLIAQNELQTCQNFWFLGNQRSLAPRGGLSAAQSSIGVDIVGTFYDIDSNTLLIFGADQSIFRLTELGASPESIGKLTGKRRPVCAKFQDKLWIASGDKLQYYDFANTDNISTGNQLTGDADVSSWAIYRIATDSDAVGRQAAMPIGNDVIFVSREGLKTLATTMDYGNISTGTIGEKFNQLVTTSQYDPQLYHLRRRKILLIRPMQDRTHFIAYNYALGAATTLFFALPVTDIIETMDKVIVASGTSLYELSDEYLDDSGKPIEYVAQLKDTVSTNKIIVRSVDTDMIAYQTADVSVAIDNMNLTMPANARRKVRCNHTTHKMQITISGKSQFQIKHVIVEVADL